MGSVSPEAGAIVVGAVVTHNPLPGDVERAIASLKVACDHVLVFDDGSDAETVARIKATGVTGMFSSKAEPRLLLLRRAMLYHEAERLGADWFVYIDQDEELSPTIQHSLHALLSNLSHGNSKDSNVTSLLAPIIHYYEDLRHRTISKTGWKFPMEFLAWRANVGFDYYGSLAALFQDTSSGAAQKSVHFARQPAKAQAKTLALRFPYGAILHYANSTKERLAARIAREQVTGLTNDINTLGAAFTVDVPESPEWNDISKCNRMWEDEG